LKTTYKTKGICPSKIAIELEGDTIKEVEFAGGCNGNLKGISQLVKGMSVSETIVRLEGIRCGIRRSSCPDQLAWALREMVGICSSSLHEGAVSEAD